MTKETFAASINVVLYLTMSFGFYLLFHSTIYFIVERVKMLRRLNYRGKEGKEGSLSARLRRFLRGSVGYEISPSLFLTMLAAGLFSLFLFFRHYFGSFFSMCLSVFVLAMPFLLLMIRLDNLRRRSSYEGERLVSEILREYRVNDLNIYEAIENVVAAPAGIKVSLGSLSKLLYDLRNTGDPVMIKLAADNFAYAIDTNWSRMLAHNICIAAAKGSDVSLAIEDILIQLRDARRIAEARKRLNSEAGRITFFMVPCMYFLTVLMAVKYLDVPFWKLMRNQFGTVEGIIFFYLIIFLFVANVVLLRLVTNQRFDY